MSLYLFGPFEIFLDDRPLPRLRSRKSLWLLALLTLRHGAEVERDWLAGLLWPEHADRQALRNSLAELRRALGPEAERLRSPTSHTLSLDLSGAAVDVVAFDAAMARGDPDALAEAVGLYRGPLLEGCAEEWIFQEQEAREQAYLTALERLAAQSLASGEWTTAEGHLRRAAAVDPLRESVQRGLMEALAGSGSHGGAFEVYRELRLRLHRELNAEPDPETNALYQQIRAEARERAGARTPPADSVPATGPMGWGQERSDARGGPNTQYPIPNTQYPIPSTRRPQPPAAAHPLHRAGAGDGGDRETIGAASPGHAHRRGWLRQDAPGTRSRRSPGGLLRRRGTMGRTGDSGGPRSRAPGSGLRTGSA